MAWSIKRRQRKNLWGYVAQELEYRHYRLTFLRRRRLKKLVRYVFDDAMSINETGDWHDADLRKMGIICINTIALHLENLGDETEVFGKPRAARLLKRLENSAQD
ncbi:MAG TPA: hypothetical protein VK497_02775 [Candidatus Saccharimonadales bacterium]|nr:hypothetical protein [Candidatus Saccharimonadales bacterium]